LQVAGVVVLDVADDIFIRLGEPTVTALTRRFDSSGTCLTCEGRLGTVPLSVRAYRGLHEEVTLVAYHAACAASAWVDLGQNVMIRHETWAAAATSTVVHMAVRRWLRPPLRRERDQRMPVMLVRPSLEMIRVRQVGLGEAVNTDLEAYGSLGFADLSTLSGAQLLRAVGLARVQSAGDDAVLYATAADRTWLTPVSPAVAALAAARGGVLIGVTCDRAPGRLAVDAGYLEYAMGNGDVLLGWAPLPGRRSDYRPYRGRVRLRRDGSAAR
jgi:hypothetical protein